MCGIGGFSGDFDPAGLKKINILQGHRGPDDEGVWFDSENQTGLAHRRLSILDTSSAGHQPMWDVAKRVLISFNGEIYNYRSLRRELEQEGFEFHSDTDTEVIINLYIRDGSEMLSQLNGIFAFAIWDVTKRELFIARDGLGVKPLYYTQSSKGVAFASEIKALIPLVPETRELDHKALHRYLSFLWCPGDGTPLRGVRKLLPGEAMVVSKGKITKQWNWYQLPIFRGVTEHLSEADAISEVTNGLRNAVHRQLVSDVPVGAFLSGGLDSSAIVAFAREQTPNIHCFTIQTEGGQELGIVEDLPYARKVAKHLGVPLSVVQVDASSMASDLERMVTQLDEPLADPAPLNVLYISQLARKEGVKVLLSGAGGDDLFTGYRRHVAVQHEYLWNWLPSGIRSALEQGTSRLDQRNSLFRRLSKLFRGASLNGDEHLAMYFAWARESDLLELYTPAFRASLEHEKASQPMLDFLSSIPSTAQPLDRMLALEQRFFLSDHNLTYTDKMSMAAGIEVRVPFLDVDLVERAAQIPNSLKQKGRVGKWILKKAMEPYLPHDVIYRPKSGFGAPLRRWMRYELRELLGDLLSEDSLKRRGLFEPSAVQRLIHNNDKGRVDAAYILLSLLNIEIWCRSFLDTKY